MKPAIFEEVENQLIDALAIRTLMEYEQDNIGQVAPALQYGDPCWVANMVVYILGEIIPVILKPLMDEAIAEMNASNINQLAEAMVYVINELIPQEQDNG